jgi:hypothetical protein
MTIMLDDELSHWLAQEAKRRGKTVDEVAAQLLRDSMKHIPANSTERRSVMDFAGIGARRPGSLSGKDAQEYVEEQRAEWDDRKAM